MVLYHLYHAGPTIVLYTIPPLCNGTRNCSMYWSHHRGKNPVEEIAQAVPYWCPTPPFSCALCRPKIVTHAPICAKTTPPCDVPFFLRRNFKGKIFPKNILTHFPQGYFLGQRNKSLFMCTWNCFLQLTVHTLLKYYLLEYLEWQQNMRPFAKMRSREAIKASWRIKSLTGGHWSLILVDGCGY